MAKLAINGDGVGKERGGEGEGRGERGRKESKKGRRCETDAAMPLPPLLSLLV